MSFSMLRGAAMSTQAFRRYISSTPKLSSRPLPFEKPIYESKILTKTRATKEFHRRDVLVIGVSLSLLGRMGYYIMYGKESGAGPLPRRDRNKIKE